MPHQTLRTLTGLDPRRRVVIFERPDGSFGFEEQRFGAAEQAWFPGGRYSHSICDSADAAEREARQRVTWLDARDGLATISNP